MSALAHARDGNSAGAAEDRVHAAGEARVQTFRQTLKGGSFLNQNLSAESQHGIVAADGNGRRVVRTGGGF